MGLGKDELLQPSDAEADLDCPICMGIVVDAVACSCTHTFCRVCIERVLNGDARCPMCRQGASAGDLRSCHLLDLRVNGLTVCCERRCGWYGRRDERRAHSRACHVARAQEFTVLLQGDLGISLEHVDGQHLVVLNVKASGAVQEYNLTVQRCPARQVGRGCAVVEVNGLRGDSEELLYVFHKAKDKGDKLRLVFRWPTEFCATVNKHANRLGLVLGVPAVDAMPFLVISSVRAGAVMNHNSTNAEVGLKSFDRIVEVNGLQGGPEELLDRIHKAETCTMRIRRFGP